jgi:hypothetical protein
MWSDFQVSLLACNLATPYLGREPKARVVTAWIPNTNTLGIVIVVVKRTNWWVFITFAFNNCINLSSTIGNGWIGVPPIDNMNMLMFQHLDFLLKSICDMELVIFHLDHVLISLAKCLVDKWFLIEKCGCCSRFNRFYMWYIIWLIKCSLVNMMKLLQFFE